MAWRDSLRRSLMSIAGASAFRSTAPRSAPPGLRPPSVFSSRLNPGLFSFSNPSTLGQLGCTQLLLPLHSMVTGVRMMSRVAPFCSDKRNIRDHKRRLLAAKYEVRRKLYKALCRDPDLPSDMREKHRHKLSELPRKSSFTQVRNRCVFTGRPRAVYRRFRMSRIIFRRSANRGELMGVKKSSW